MNRIKRRLRIIARKQKRAISVLDRARKGLEFVRPGMRLAISC